MAGGSARALVALRWLIPLGWVAAAVAATISLPQLSASEEGGSWDDMVPAGSEAARASTLATEEFGAPLVTDTLVVQRDPEGLTPEQQRLQLRTAFRTTARGDRPGPRPRAAVPINDSPTGALGIGPAATTGLTYLYFDADIPLGQRTALARRYADERLGGDAGAVAGVTGAAPARLTEMGAIEDSLPLIEIGSVILVLAIVAFAFRSAGAPLMTLFCGAIAYLLLVRLVPWAGERLGIPIPADVEPVLVVLLVGLVTDYCVFYLAAMRRHLEAGEERLPAARTAIAETLPIVFTAGLIITAGTAALAVAELDFFRAFGPGLALTTVISVLVAGTLAPAMVAIFGARLFGRSLTRSDREVAESTAANGGSGAAAGVRRDLKLDEVDEDPSLLRRGRRALARPLLALRRAPALGREEQTSRWRAVIARVASARPVAFVIALVTVGLLLLAASNLRTTELGLTLISGLPPDDEVSQAADAAAAGLGPGVLGPTEIDLVEPGIAANEDALAELETLVADRAGVSAVVGPREQDPVGAPKVFVSEDGGAARLAVFLDDDPLSPPAIDTVRELRRDMPDLLAQAGVGSGEVAVGGQTVLAQETVEALGDDLLLVGIVAVLANLILLIAYMRALIAPLYLVAASILGLAATLGLTTLFFQELLDQPGLTYYVPFAAAILLMALGSDYNVFVAGRIWQQARSRRLREAIAVAVPSAARAITVAGIALAASFALLAIVPLQSFREFAFVMSVGVLVDTFIVRSLLIPSLTALVGERAWWPGPRVKPLPSDGFVERVAAAGDLDVPAAERASQAALATLAERINSRERDELARRLPDHLADHLREPGSGGGDFPLREFLERMQRREEAGSIDETEQHAQAVMTALEEVTPGGLDYVLVQLSEDYDELFRRSAQPDRQRRELVDER